VTGSITALRQASGIAGGRNPGMDPVAAFPGGPGRPWRGLAGDGGPAFLEFTTYRSGLSRAFGFWAGPRYRDATEVARWRARDPPLSATS